MRWLTWWPSRRWRRSWMSGRWEQKIVLWEWRDGRQCDECGMYYGGRWRYVRHFWQPVPEWSYHDEDE